MLAQLPQVGEAQAVSYINFPVAAIKLLSEVRLVARVSLDRESAGFARASTEGTEGRKAQRISKAEVET